MKKKWNHECCTIRYLTFGIIIIIGNRSNCSLLDNMLNFGWFFSLCLWCFELRLLKSTIIHTSEAVVLGLKNGCMGTLDRRCVLAEGENVSSLPLLHPTCCELTQPGHTGPSTTAVTGEMTTATRACSPEHSLLFIKLALLSQLNLNNLDEKVHWSSTF